MIKLSEATAIALHSMIYLTNRENEIVSLKEIADRFKISENHLSKVLQRLVKAGYLISHKGPKGGFSIVSKIKNITFMQVYEITEGRFQEQECLFNSLQSNCPNCIMNNLIKRINHEFVSYMKNNKISDFVM